MKLEDQIAFWHHLSLLLQADSYAKDNNKVDERKTEINRLRTDYLSQATQNNTLRLQIELRNKNESHRASKAEKATKSANPYLLEKVI